MAQPAPTNIDLRTLWSDGTGQTPTGAGYTQIIRQPNDPRYDNFLKAVTRGFNNNAQSVLRHGRIQLIGGLPRGYTLWITTAGKPVLWLYGHPTINFRSAVNFSDHVPELLAANRTKEISMWQKVRAYNVIMATAAVDNYNEWAASQHLPQRNRNDYVAAWGLPGFTSVNENVAVQRDRQIHPRISFNCSCVYR